MFLLGYLITQQLTILMGSKIHQELLWFLIAKGSGLEPRNYHRKGKEGKEIPLIRLI
jgi:hypothetical protein